MKNAILACALLCTSVLNAQDGKPVRFGLSVAPNIGWISPDKKDIKSDGSVMGFNFGLLADFRLGNDNYALGTGLFYMTKVGGKFTYVPNDSSSFQVNARMQYVQLPLTMKLKTNEIGYITYFGLIGADLGLNVGAKADHTHKSGRTTTEVSDDDFSDNVSLFRAGLKVGGGLEYNFSGNTSAVVGITYNNGFTNVFDKDYSKGKLHYVELALGVFF